MRFSVFYIVCAIVVYSRDVLCSNAIKELLFPRAPMVTRSRHITDQTRFIDDEFAILDTVGLIEIHGYPAEEHNVTTEDGYNIIYFRIPGSPKSPPKSGKPIVFILHGMVASSDSWVLLGPDKDLAFLLADAGYDVWLGNIRGNTYGRSHTDLSPTGREFWEFSYHEIGIFDLPKMIDHALEYTNQKTLYYIGHSMGTTAALVMVSEKLEYNDKIRFFISLAPIALWKEVSNPFVRLAVLKGQVLKDLLDRQGIFDLAPLTRNNGRLGRALCSDSSIMQPACAKVYFLIAGHDPKQLNVSILPHVMSYMPAGVSTKTVFHFRQNILTGAFQPYDYGYTENYKIYGKMKPLPYNLNKVTVPLSIIYGRSDALSLEANTIELAKRLPNLVSIEAVPYETFNHLDFLWAINGKELVYDRIIELLSKAPV